ncbi:MAG: squalene/phytoene synthase family protein [Pseudomonadota bacterium]
MSLDSALSGCLETLQQQDYDRYLACLFAAPDDRLALTALHALNAELGKVRESVSEPMLGEIRLTWWREAIEGLCDGQVRKHPIVEALAAPVASKLVSADALMDMVEARIADLYEDAPRNTAALEDYAAKTGGLLLRQCLSATGADMQQCDAAQSIGTAMTMGGVVRAISFHASMRRIHLPADELAAIGLSPEQVFQGEFTPAITALAQVIGQNALDQLRAGLKKPWPKRQRRALAPALFALKDMQRAQAAGFDPQRPSPPVAKPLKIARTWWFIQSGFGVV